MKRLGLNDFSGFSGFSGSQDRQPVPELCLTSKYLLMYLTQVPNVSTEVVYSTALYNTCRSLSGRYLR